MRLWLPITSTLSLGSILFPIWRRQETPKTALLSRRRHISYPRNYKGDEYKLSAQWFLGSVGWTSVSYDWLMVAWNRIPSANHNWRLSTQTNPEIVAPKACTHDSPHSFWSGMKHSSRIWTRRKPSPFSYTVRVFVKASDPICLVLLGYVFMLTPCSLYHRKTMCMRSETL